MNMTMATRQAGTVTIVDIKGRILLGEESSAMRDMVCDLLSKGHKQILLNLGSVEYIDSVGLGSLIGAFTSTRRQGGELKVVNVTNRVTDIMQLTKLYPVFEIANDEAEGTNLLFNRKRQLSPDLPRTWLRVEPRKQLGNYTAE